MELDKYLVFFIFISHLFCCFLQALTTLNLEHNQIRAAGTQAIVQALEKNEVR